MFRPMRRKNRAINEDAARQLLHTARRGILAVNGDDLLLLGMSPGKELGETLRFLLQAVIDGKCENNRENLLEYCQKYRQIP